MITHWDFPSADPWTNFPPPISTLWFPRPILLSFQFLHPFPCLLVQKSPELWNQVKIVKAVIIVVSKSRICNNAPRLIAFDWICCSLGFCPPSPLEVISWIRINAIRNMQKYRYKGWQHLIWQCSTLIISTTLSTKWCGTSQETVSGHLRPW